MTTITTQDPPQLNINPPQSNINPSQLNIKPSQSNIKPPQLQLFRVMRDKTYDKINQNQLNQFGFLFDSDVFVYTENQTQLTSIVLNKHLFVTSQSFKEEDGTIHDNGLQKINNWLVRMGKLPSYLQVQESKLKGFGIFAKEQIESNNFIGYYDGIRIPKSNNIVQNNYIFECETELIDGQNLTFSNFTSLINEGQTPNIGFLQHNNQQLAVTTRLIQPGEELLTTYGNNYWTTNKNKQIN